MNDLLDALQATGLERADCVPVQLLRGQVLCEEGAAATQVVFPTSALVGSVVPFVNGSLGAAGVVGCDGASGLDSLGGSRRSIARWIVHVAGGAVAVPAEVLRRQVAGSAGARERVERFGQALLAQCTQALACAAYHGAEQRTAMWLLTCGDRLPVGNVALTHEILGTLVGVRRPTSTTIARMLRSRDLIRYARGTIRVVDRAGLRAASCECYDAIRRIYETVLAFTPPCDRAATLPGDATAPREREPSASGRST